MYLDDTFHSGLVCQWGIQWLFSDPLPFISKGCEMLSVPNQPLPIGSTHPLITIHLHDITCQGHHLGLRTRFHPSFRGVIRSLMYLILLPFEPFKNTTKILQGSKTCVWVCVKHT